MNINHNKDFFNSLAEAWDDVTNHDPEKIRYLLSQIDLKQMDSVLDVGCGTGILTPFLMELLGDEGKLTAIDLAENMIEKAKAKYKHLPVHFVQGDVTSHPFPNCTFDAVICYSVYPHFIDPLQTIKTLYRLLKKDGKLLVCHSESRLAINNHHKKLKNKLISHSLPSGKEVAKIFHEAGFLRINFKDKENLYFVLGEKNEINKNLEQ